MSLREDTQNALAALAVAIQTPGPDGNLGIPILLWGPPGVGKTARVNLVMDVLGFHLETVLASLRGPEDFLGMPLVDYSTSPPQTFYAMPDWAKRMVALNPAFIDYFTGSPVKRKGMEQTRSRKIDAAAPPPPPPPRAPSLPQGIGRPAPPPAAAAPVAPEGAVDQPPRRPGAEHAGKVNVPATLFLDEISAAPPRVQAALLRIVHERVVGDVPLPPSVAIVAAANPPEEAVAGAVELPLPMANRFCHINWPDVDPAEWGIWIQVQAARISANALAANTAADAKERMAKDEASLREFLRKFIVPYSIFAQRFALYSSVAAGFLRADTELTKYMRNMPKPGTKDPVTRKTVNAWPSPRSWDMGLRLYAAADACGDDGVARLLLTGCIGDTAASAFIDHLDAVQMPPWQECFRKAQVGILAWPITARNRSNAVRLIDEAVVAGIRQYKAQPEAWIAEGAWMFLVLLVEANYGVDVVRAGYASLVEAKIPAPARAKALQADIGRTFAKLAAMTSGSGGSSLARA